MRPVHFPVQFRWLGLLLALSLLVPFATAMAEKETDKPGRRAAPGALTLPLAGTVVDAANRPVGRFSGSVTINRFASQNDRIVAIGVASGTVTGLAGQVVKSGSPVTLDISGDAAGPLGALVCQIVALLGTVADVVGLLNQLLGLLTGLLGGLTGV